MSSSKSERPECVLYGVAHSYRQHPDDRTLWACVGCGDQLECTCAMTETSQAHCEVHGYDGIEI